MSIDPDRVRINGDGQFATDAEACGFGRFFNNCGGFIDNPDFFCGVNLNPEEFCGFSFEPSVFCFGGGFGGFSPFSGQFSGQFPGHFPGQFSGQFPDQFSGQFPGQFSGCERFRCGFQRIPVVEFCRFHFFSLCFRRHNRIVTLLVRAVDDHTGDESNTAVIRFGFNF